MARFVRRDRVAGVMGRSTSRTAASLESERIGAVLASREEYERIEAEGIAQRAAVKRASRAAHGDACECSACRRGVVRA